MKSSMMKLCILAACLLLCNICVHAKNSVKPSKRALPKNVPELLTTENGRKVTDVKMWEEVRRKELFDTFMREEYGIRPDAANERSHVSFKVTDEREAMNGKAVRKLITITYKGPCGTLAFPVTAFIPKSEKKVPAFVLICNRPAAENIDPERKKKSGFWPAEEIVARGYAAIAFWNGHIAPDDKKSKCRKGIFPCVEANNKRSKSSWATLSAWAWGASRVMDWIESEKLIDNTRVAVVGHSRGGKTSLLTGVTDTRFAMACVNNSGCSGAKLNHINLPKSESIAIITKNFPHWFCGNYLKYIKKEMVMPFDQHQMVALMAPRLVAIASATKDDWAGQMGEWWSAKLASPAWELYGKKGLDAEKYPSPEAPQQKGCISYHLRSGIHNLTPYDWKCYMDFADKHGWRK